MSRKEKERELRKRNIVVAAEKLFFEKGYDKVTMDEIAQASEFSKPTLYKYFRSIEEVYLLVHMNGLKVRMKCVEEMDKFKSGEDKLYEFGRSFYDYAKNNPEYFKLQIYWDYNDLNLDKISPEVISEITSQTQIPDNKIREAIQLVSNGTDFLEKKSLDMTLAAFYLTLRTILNQVLKTPKHGEIFCDEPELYFNYLRIFIRGLKK
ncbi:MAG: TetR/AcrR family transcriptional regulator [Candidatus Delongbacteria bacterium]|nr:TetR/AcrR family transcriptional regulator [Candidatus Delongbacteria bacterium]